MKNWMLPLAVLGMSGLGLALSCERSRKQMFAFLANLAASTDPLADFGRAMDQQLEHIQEALNDLASSLEGQHQETP